MNYVIVARSPNEIFFLPWHKPASVFISLWAGAGLFRVTPAVGPRFLGSHLKGPPPPRARTVPFSRLVPQTLRTHSKPEPHGIFYIYLHNFKYKYA